MTISLFGRGLDAIAQHDHTGMAPDITNAARRQRYEPTHKLRRNTPYPEFSEIEQLGRNPQTAWRNQRQDLKQLPQHFAAIGKEHSNNGSR
ncbi:hypothetical protein RM61_09400 [Xanthomonas phaseoli pv. phaseoli]|uniref:hypothetical protein n=1 Tax=Xanthomonas phaseoli TaxID=1985254 RepID=UPI0005740697|nr:hypothetical protein [Xanthomonas phaseoli]KHS07667.1 hypothetical protein RM61_09400 [Xanthomonas phaseoli pv. phaseoli]